MKKIDLETVYTYLESPDSFTEEESMDIQHFLISIKEKLNQTNLKYGTNIEVSEYINAALEKAHVAV